MARLLTRLTRKARWFWPLALALFVADCAAKRAAETHLIVGAPQEVAGDVLRLTLSYNRAAAMGIGIGSNARAVLAALSGVILLVLAVVYRATAPHDRWRAAGVALVVGGALGNLVDRLRSPAGVVDFIDLGIGHARFWTFNLADIGITIGAVILLIVFGRWVPLPALRQPPRTALPTGD
ncbi:MAG: signal peptidase II [Gemmatimonadales bacterium]